AIADKAIAENRAVGLTTNGNRSAVLPADRGSRQHLKIMQLLAAVDADGSTPLSEALLAGLGRVRRGMTAVVITSSIAPDWVRPLATLRARGVACVVIWLDAAAFEDRAAAARNEQPDPATAQLAAQRARALRHALAEYDLPVKVVTPARPLAEVLVG
ncbi:MAG TPA: hypothetical protein VGK63_02610, partial [Candidatus Limnocylindrales bacterium]